MQWPTQPAKKGNCFEPHPEYSGAVNYEWPVANRTPGNSNPRVNKKCNGGIEYVRQDQVQKKELPIP